MDPDLTMAVLAPAKVNLSLRVTGRRADGFHLLQSLMVPVSLYDELRITATQGDAGRITLTCDTPGIPGGQDNLVCRAARLLLARTATEAGLRIDLRKRIPVGSGLGGGSSDAAATLTTLNRLLKTRRTPAQLASWGAEVGADVPFFCVRPPGLGRGHRRSRDAAGPMADLGLGGRLPGVGAFDSGDFPALRCRRSPLRRGTGFVDKVPFGH
jgi:4-diphosphocytidyl-2-C-methyl-D-erythritol kinase